MISVYIHPTSGIRNYQIVKAYRSDAIRTAFESIKLNTNDKNPVWKGVTLMTGFSFEFYGIGNQEHIFLISRKPRHCNVEIPSDLISELSRIRDGFFRRIEGSPAGYSMLMQKYINFSSSSSNRQENGGNLLKISKQAEGMTTEIANKSLERSQEIDALRWHLIETVIPPKRAGPSTNKLPYVWNE